MIRSLDTKLVTKVLNWDVFENKQKKNLKKNWEKRFLIFLLFSKVLTVRRPKRKASGFWTVRILKICLTSGPDVMSGRALLFRNWQFCNYFWAFDTFFPHKVVSQQLFPNFLLKRLKIFSCHFWAWFFVLFWIHRVKIRHIKGDMLLKSSIIPPV